VKVRGPQSQVVVLQHVRAEAFDVHGLKESSYPRELAIERPSPSLKIDPARVIVTAEITREVQSVSSRSWQSPSWSREGPKSTGRGRCASRLPPDIVRSLRPEQIVPQVEVTSKEASGSQSLPIRVKIDKCDAYIVPRDVIARW